MHGCRNHGRPWFAAIVSVLLFFLLVTAADARSARAYPLGNRRVGEAAHPGPPTDINPFDDSDGEIWEQGDLTCCNDFLAARCPDDDANEDVTNLPGLVSDSGGDQNAVFDEPDSDDDGDSDMDHAPVRFDAAWDVAERLCGARPPLAPAAEQALRPLSAPRLVRVTCSARALRAPSKATCLRQTVPRGTSLTRRSTPRR